MLYYSIMHSLEKKILIQSLFFIIHSIITETSPLLNTIRLDIILHVG